MAAATKKKALVFSPILATVGVDKKVPERRKYGISDWNGFEEEKDDICNLQRSASQRHLLLNESRSLGSLFRGGSF